MKRNSQSGVALIITLILLAMITFMAVTFLVVSRRERERTAVQSSQSDATHAAAQAVEQFKAALASSMMARTNGYDFGLWVSTNYYRPFGFDNTPGPGYSRFTNVSYVYPNGAPVTGNDHLQSLNNLQLLPRAPVFIVTNNVTGAKEFRFYVDLNRNRRFDTNGFINWLDASGDVVENNHLAVGDLEWVGILDKPEQRHSSSNLFVARYAFIALPIGNSLDMNYIHNQAKLINPKVDGFLRNQGVGSWENNLAGFLYYLNTNVYAWGGRYDYSTDLGRSSDGAAFLDAQALTSWRYNNNYNLLKSANGLFGGTAFGADFVDEYARGPLWLTDTPLNVDQDVVSRPWPGSDNPQHLFTSQEPFTALLGALTFSNRLYSLGFNPSSYDRYTYYRMLSQLSFDSAPESTNKINLNYDNNYKSVYSANTIPWTNAVQFFTNTAEMLLEDLTNTANSSFVYSNGSVVTNIQLYPPGFSVNFIPIYPTNYYSSAVHRALQLAANIFDATTNRPFGSGFGIGGDTNYFPSVFRPHFGVTNSGSGLVIFISGYEEQGKNPDLSAPLALPEQASLVTANCNIYDVPWIIGAKKGLPNFNEFSMQTFSQITRKMQLNKQTALNPDRGQWRTNQMFVIGISNVVGMEAWNSYFNNYPRQVSILATNDLVLTLTLTNDAGTVLYSTIVNQPSSAVYSIVNWAGFRNTGGAADKASFQIPINTNSIFVPDSFYRTANPRGLFPAGGNDVFEQTTDFRAPHFVLGMTNRMRFIMVDTATGQIIDYASFNGITNVVDLTAQLPQYDTPRDPLSFWDTNLLSTSMLNPAAPPLGVQNQIQGSLSPTRIPLNNWNDAQLGSATVQSKAAAITKFAAFYNNDPADTNIVAQIPFTPTRKFSDYRSWQANDPLVHYTLNDLANYPQTNQFTLIVPPNNASTNQSLANLRQVNTRYRPWGGNPLSKDPATDYNLAIKDPLVRNSDGWQFPTNKFATIGGLGGVHRGTPWQTVYLKSAPVNAAAWQTWTGNRFPVDALLSQPTNDWRLLDLFTTAPNANATRGQLSVNQTNLAAWAAVLQGVMVLSNSASDSDLVNYVPWNYTPLAIDPATNEAGFYQIVNAINDVRRTNSPSTGRVFQHVGDVLAVPELTVNSPYLNTSSTLQTQSGLNDAAYERIPRQIMSLLKVGEPRYVIFAYGQSLKPADRSLIQSSGPYFGMCTNYQITGEVVTRTVIRVVNRPVPRSLYRNPALPLPPPQIIVESFNVLPPE